MQRLPKPLFACFGQQWETRGKGDLQKVLSKGARPGHGLLTSLLGFIIAVFVMFWVSAHPPASGWLRFSLPRGVFEDESMLTESLELTAQRGLPRTDRVCPSPAAADGVFPLTPSLPPFSWPFLQKASLPFIYIFKENTQSIVS